MTHDQEREDLDALVTSPGWLRVTQWAKEDFAARMTQATESAANLTDDVAAINQLRQVIAAKRAVELVLAYPRQRMKALAQPVESDELVSLSRGGVR